MSAFPAYNEQPSEPQAGEENGTNNTFGNLGQNQPQQDNAAQAAGAQDGSFNGNGAEPTEGATPAAGADPKTTLWCDF